MGTLLKRNLGLEKNALDSQFGGSPGSQKGTMPIRSKSSQFFYFKFQGCHSIRRHALYPLACTAVAMW